MRRNHNTNQQGSVTRFALGQTFITAGAEEALQIAGQTAIEFLRRHMSCDWGSELSNEDAQENELSLKEGFRLLSAYRTGKGQKLFGSSPKQTAVRRPSCFRLNTETNNRKKEQRGCHYHPRRLHRDLTIFKEKPDAR